MVDDSASFVTTTKGSGREAHRPEGSEPKNHSRPSRTRHTVRVSTAESFEVISYGPGVDGDDELRLCGDLSEGKRALELGISSGRNSIAFAIAGAKAIAVDPDADRIAELRQMAARRELTVECHTAELADLGVVTSGSIELVLADRTLGAVDDLGRLLRQVHRVLKPGHPFVIAMEHPFAPLVGELSAGSPTTRSYGTGTRTIGEWFTALGRSNFRIDALHELGGAGSPAPTTLVMRARKEGS
jgi:SAM-dependent methyltransferase